MTAELHGDSIVLDGFAPWVTGAPRADFILTGGVLEGGDQILAVLPMDTPSVEVGPPQPLMALQGSVTAELRCNRVKLDRRWLLAGPADRVMQVVQGGRTTGGLETSCLALGLAGAAIDYLRSESERRDDLKSDAERLQSLRLRLREQMHDLAQSASPPEASQNLRAGANTLVLQATQAALAASKGTGFLRHHPAQRWARQALFFLVWSCPRPVAEATVGYLLAASDQICS